MSDEAGPGIDPFAGAGPSTYGEATLYGDELKFLRTERWKLIFRPEPSPGPEGDAGVRPAPVDTPLDPARVRLFDVIADPDEIVNLARLPGAESRLSRFRDQASRHWDTEVVRDTVIADQRRRRVLHSALRRGRYHGWDWQPVRNVAEEYIRSHLDVAEMETSARFPRPAPFRPRSR